jgi:hypothetical protein
LLKGDILTKVNKGLYTINSGKLPKWANNICQWAAMKKTIDGWFNEVDEYNKSRKDKSLWWRFWHSEHRYPPSFVRENPFPQPSSVDLEKFEKEYPDMAKEWL